MLAQRVNIDVLHRSTLNSASPKTSSGVFSYPSVRNKTVEAKYEEVFVMPSRSGSLPEIASKTTLAALAIELCGSILLSLSCFSSGFKKLLNRVRLDLRVGLMQEYAETHRSDVADNAFSQNESTASSRQVNHCCVVFARFFTKYSPGASQRIYLKI